MKIFGIPDTKDFNYPHVDILSFNPNGKIARVARYSAHFDSDYSEYPLVIQDQI